MFKNIIRVLGGDPNKKAIDNLRDTLVFEVNKLEPAFEKLSDAELKALTAEFRQRLADGESLDDLMPEAFAAVREASKRTLGMRHYDVQLICGAVLHQGKISEMRTGEGKTLAATLPIYLNALTGRGVHLVTVNDYLARRDARWMAPIFEMLDMKVGVLQMAARTDGAKKAFVVNLEKTSPHEDRHQLEMVHRSEAYAADVTYGMNSEFGFDYLRDNQAIRLVDRVQRGHYFAIIDEVDNILIDEARTPLIISGPASDDTEWYVRMAQVVERLKEEDYEVSEKDRSVSLTDAGEIHVEELLEMQLRDPERPEDITPEQARILGYLEQGLRAKHLYKRNKDYLVQSGRVVIVDSSTGRMMPGRRWSEGLHQAVEAKEGVKVNPENVTYATITLQNYYRMYEKLSGMTGTALTESEEFHEIYELQVLPIPTNLEFQVASEDSVLEELKAKDELGYEYTYYARRDDQQNKPVFWKRKDYTDVVYRTLEAKLRAIVREVVHFWVLGRPQLVGTTSVENSEMLSQRLGSRLVKLYMQAALIRQAWMEANNTPMIDRSIPELKTLGESLDTLNPGMLRSLARDLNLNINLSLEDPQNIQLLLKVFDLQEENIPRLIEAIKGGIPHLVLNARKHDEESQLIEKAGAFGAVTIATNMAGRGVDIKLGGELPEDVNANISLVLENLGHDPYEMTLEEKSRILKDIAADKLSVVRAESVKTFLEYVENMRKVKELGGLHVIGSERYESRRIDNQLRGRAARQGDPGSSRYYLSLEDDLMRLFGGAQVENMWKRVFFDDDQPLEMRLIGRIVEGSQERVEGANFDARKHVLEYDDVLNTQRKRIYEQRDRVFVKEDLSEDVLDMLRIELQPRIEKGLADEEGPWRLMAYLDQIQPSFTHEGVVYPSYPMREVINALREELSGKAAVPENLGPALLKIAEKAMQAHKEHVLRGTEVLLDKAQESMDRQIEERLDTLDAFLDSLSDYEDQSQLPGPKELLAEISGYVHIPLRLTPDQLQRLPDGDEDVIEELKNQVRTVLMAITLKRILGSLERRLGALIELDLSKLQNMEWADVYDLVLRTVIGFFDAQISRLLGPSGQISQDLQNIFGHLSGAEEDLSMEKSLGYLMLMVQGSRLAFDKRTHKKVQKRYIRFTYHYLAAKLIEDLPAENVTKEILEHLEGALQALIQTSGNLEWSRLTQQFDANLNHLDETVKALIRERIGAEHFEQISSTPFSGLSAEDAEMIRQVLGERLRNEAYREILVRVISSQWIDYLTQVEALRISIGMEAYAQRDPLVQYKSRATEMFSELLASIRMGVISRLFIHRVRKDSVVTLDRERVESKPELESEIRAEPEQSEAAPAQAAGANGESGGKKKRRRRR